MVTAGPQEGARVAAATLTAAEDYLKEVAADPAVGETYGLLVDLMSAARGDDFEGTLRRLGVDVTESTSAVDFVADVADQLRRTLNERGAESVPGEYAALALRSVLTETVGTRPGSLFGATVHDLRLAFRDFASDRQFGVVSQRFFGDLLSRILRGALDREVPRLASSTGSAEDLLREVELHSQQSARIVRDFAADWFSKGRWQGGGSIPRDDTRAFLPVAFAKLRRELKREASR